MIVCHCMNITDHDIRAAVNWMRASDAQTIITPGKVYHALGKRADCGGCMPLLLDTLRGCDNFEVPMNLRSLGRAHRTGKDGHEGRHQGYRVSQRGVEV
ncbi:(2Fe-2S)-binding protein [Fertoebacter nigrum]|uniref:(2Fe-2S)-binding protein n=1 Tax=Fertoeibacter niger TaxID=2656921 RepID=A0A8X8H4L4_9RHOB|nr:(2Fe-2S)-binding protein [Fertoeibacter niger]NUB46262.1 (2Fe-2S)-binding protein [Fertoeibacter niger]